MAVAINKQHLELARFCTPRGDEIVRDHTSRLAVRLELPEFTVLDYCDIGMVLRDFPRLAEFLEPGHFHIDLLRCLAKDLFAVQSEHRTDIEEELIEALQPRMPNEAVPSRRRLHDLLQRIIEKHQPSARPRDDDDYEPSKFKQLSFDESYDDFTDVHVTLPKFEGLELKKILDHVCITESVSRAEALMMLIRASVEGRDGTCRFPGCSVPAHDCQLDHVKRWEEGADGVEQKRTSTDNLHCLCQRHHNLKTSGQWDVTLLRDGTETWTSYGDGHTVSTQPNGVLGQFTFDHRAVRRTRTLEEHNEQRAQKPRTEKTAAHAARDNEPMCRDWGDIPF